MVENLSDGLNHSDMEHCYPMVLPAAGGEGAVSEKLVHLNSVESLGVALSD